MATITNTALNSRSLNGIITISDGNGTTIENGNIETGDINSNSLTTNTINTSLLTCTGEFRCNINGPLTIPISISSLTGLLISYGNTTNSGATDFTNFGSTYTTTQQGFRFFNKSNTQTLTNLAIIDNTQTYFMSQLTGCLAENPISNNSVANKIYCDTNFMFKTGAVAENINGVKNFLNRVDFNGSTAIIVAGTTTFNGINTMNAQTTFNNSAPISNTAPTLSTHLTTKNYTDTTFQTISNMTNYVDISTSQSISGIKTFNSAPICSIVPTINSELTNKLYVDNAVSGGSILSLNNTFTGTNLFNNAVSMANTLTFSAATININSSTTTHATNLFSLITSGTQNLWSNLSNNAVVNFFSSATSDVNLNINARVKFRQVKLYNQVKIITGGSLSFPLEENILINSAVNLTITLPVITINSLGLTFNFIKNNLLRTHTFTAQSTDTIVKNGFISGSTSQILMDDGITSFQLVILEMVSGSGLYNWVVVNSSLPQTISNPIGSILTMSVNSTPPGYLLCDGTSYSTTLTYVALFNVIGYTYGGAPSSTFKVPDFRGIFLRGSGINGANANYVSSIVGTIQNDAIKAHSHDFTFQVPNNISSGGSSRACEVATTGYANTIATQNQSIDAETRPANYAVVYFIKY